MMVTQYCMMVTQHDPLMVVQLCIPFDDNAASYDPSDGNIAPDGNAALYAPYDGNTAPLMVMQHCRVFGRLPSNG